MFITNLIPRPFKWWRKPNLTGQDKIWTIKGLASSLMLFYDNPTTIIFCVLIYALCTARATILSPNNLLQVLQHHIVDPNPLTCVPHTNSCYGNLHTHCDLVYPS